MTNHSFPVRSSPLFCHTDQRSPDDRRTVRERVALYADRYARGLDIFTGRRRTNHRDPQPAKRRPQTD